MRPQFIAFIKTFGGRYVKRKIKENKKNQENGTENHIQIFAQYYFVTIHHIF
jgi:hypothetical protein